MKYECQNHFMIRIPSFPVHIFNKINDENLSELHSTFHKEADEEFFEESILVASQDLYLSIKNTPTSNKKKRHLDASILKYIIRASTRPTPYGLFAGVGLGNFSDHSRVVIDQESYLKDVRVDAHWLTHIVHQIETDENILCCLSVKFNPICYVHGERIFNPYFSNHGEINQNSPQTILSNDIRFTNLVCLLKENATRFIPYAEIKNLVMQAYPAVQEALIDRTLRQLIENEYLLTELRTPAYCDDPLFYTLNLLNTIPTAQKYVEPLTEVYRLLEQYKRVGSRKEDLQSLYEQMRQLYITKNYLVVNKGLSFEEQVLDRTIREQLEYFTETLTMLAAPQREASRLTDLKNAFSETFGQGVEVDLQDIINPNGFDGLKYLDRSQPPKSAKEQRIQHIIDKKILLALENHEESISLHREDFVDLIKPDEQDKPAMSFDINFYISCGKDAHGQNQYICTVAPNGGANKAGCMFQRFADAFDQESLAEYDEIYQKEMDLTKDEYVLVEVREAVSAGRLDNIVNRRKDHDYFLAIACDGAGTAGEIPIYDLCVGLSADNNLYIRSKTLDKKCKIVTGNMLNTQLNSPLLKLLKYISDEYEEQPLARIFLLTENHYVYRPRVSLDGVLLSLKTWTVAAEDFSLTDLASFKKSFSQLAERYQVDKTILMYQNDNRLLLDLQKDWAIDLLYATIKKDRSLSLSEAPIGLFDDQMVKDTNGNDYFSEFTFSFVRKKEEKQPAAVAEFAAVSAPNRLLQSERRKLILGEEGWVYLKLYGASTLQNEILTRELPELLQAVSVQRFFFLRYGDDTGRHLRVRLQFADMENAFMHFPNIYRWLEQLDQRGIINKVVFDTYERENNRYGGVALIKSTEQLFCADSAYVISLLQNFQLTEEQEQRLVYLAGMLSMLAGLAETEEELYNFLNIANERTAFRQQFHKQQDDYMRMMEQILQGNPEAIDPRFAAVANEYYARKSCIKNFRVKMNALETLSNDKPSIVRSLAHMFCNRTTGDRALERQYLSLLYHAIHTRQASKEYFEKQKVTR